MMESDKAEKRGPVVTRWDKNNWIKAIAEYTEALSDVLQSLSINPSRKPATTTKRSSTRSVSQGIEKLAESIFGLSTQLPARTDLLLEIALNPHFDDEIKKLLSRYGSTVWGEHDEDTCNPEDTCSCQIYPRDEKS
jgi:hypothetical protein